MLDKLIAIRREIGVILFLHTIIQLTRNAMIMYSPTCKNLPNISSLLMVPGISDEVVVEDEFAGSDQEWGSALYGLGLAEKENITIAHSRTGRNRVNNSFLFIDNPLTLQLQETLANAPPF